MGIFSTAITHTATAVRPRTAALSRRVRKTPCTRRFRGRLSQGREYSWVTGLYYFRARWYDPVTGRWLSPDPIGINGGLNQFVFCGNNPVNFVDPDGCDVSAVLDTTANTLTVTDLDTKQKITVSAFTGGHSFNGKITQPNTGKELPAPAGVYFITDNPNPNPNHVGWYGLIRNDKRLDDYNDDGCKGSNTEGIRLHLGQLSWGCVTVDQNQPNAAALWGSIQTLINNTKKGDPIDFITGPHVWNGTKQMPNYGFLTIK